MLAPLGWSCGAFEVCREKVEEVKTKKKKKEEVERCVFHESYENGCRSA